MILKTFNNTKKNVAKVECFEYINLQTLCRHQRECYIAIQDQKHFKHLIFIGKYDILTLAVASVNTSRASLNSMNNWARNEIGFK